MSPQLEASTDDVCAVTSTAMAAEAVAVQCLEEDLRADARLFGDHERKDSLLFFNPLSCEYFCSMSSDIRVYVHLSGVRGTRPAEFGWRFLVARDAHSTFPRTGLSPDNYSFLHQRGKVVLHFCAPEKTSLSMWTAQSEPDNFGRLCSAHDKKDESLDVISCCKGLLRSHGGSGLLNIEWCTSYAQESFSVCVFTEAFLFLSPMLYRQGEAYQIGGRGMILFCTSNIAHIWRRSCREHPDRSTARHV